jgi:hypothetical protein
MSNASSLTRLFRAILRVHKAKLPPTMRAMGDKYVKIEFLSLVNGNATQEQRSQFTTEWTRYRLQLSGEGDSESQPDVLTLMNPEQQSKMSKLYNEAKILRKQMIDDASPGNKE